MKPETTIAFIRNGDRGLVSMADLLELCDAYEALRDGLEPEIERRTSGLREALGIENAKRVQAEYDLAELRAKAEALEKDAARYRWLVASDVPWCVFKFDTGTPSMYLRPCNRPPWVDAAIDAEMAKVGGK